MSIATRARSVPAGTWFVALGVLALAVLVWHDWHTRSDEDEKWLDPEQPALQLDSPSAHIPQVRPQTRTYPPCMARWPGTVIGDC